MNVLGLFARHPVAGEVKTRLAAETGRDRAAQLYAAFVGDLTERFRATADRRVVCYTPAAAAASEYFAASAGEAYELWPQPEGSLGERMQRFFEEMLKRPEDRAVLIGSDSPTLPREFVARAFELLAVHDCVLGPATDGGYYLVGQSACARPIFDRVDWSTSHVLTQTVDRVERAGARLALLPPWYDVDSPGDVEMLRGHVAAMRAAGQSIDLAHTGPLLDRESSPAGRPR